MRPQDDRQRRSTHSTGLGRRKSPTAKVAGGLDLHSVGTAGFEPPCAAIARRSSAISSSVWPAAACQASLDYLADGRLRMSERPPPARVPCPRATPGLQWATLQASGRVARVPKRCAVTHASVVRESMSLRLLGSGLQAAS